MRKALLVLFIAGSLIFLMYLVLPGPGSVYVFPDLPDSSRSKLSGDTVEIPNINAYFSDNYRNYVVPYYQENYQGFTLFPFKPLRLNYPPEFAFTAIKDQTQSTYLEELTYPFRDSLFINGLEPLDEFGESRYIGATPFEVDGEKHATKVTLRYYPSSLWTRLIMWAGIVVSVYFLWVMTKRIIFNE